MSFTLLLGKTWYGKIGLEFNTESQAWSMLLYKRLLTCLKSCYPDPHDIKQLKYVFLPCAVLTTFSLSLVQVRGDEASLVPDFTR
jgi:hypothetical protein